MDRILLFPTVITEDHREVPAWEKDIWFDLYLKHSNKDGESHDWLGFEGLHHEPKAEFFFQQVLMPAVDYYLSCLHLKRDNSDVLVTKCFFNVTNESGMRQHNHEENHFSFVYYPHIAEGKERDLMLFDPRHKHPNEPYSRFFASNVTHWDGINARVMHLPVEEGMLYIFPSNMDHDLKLEESDRGSGILGFKTKQELLDTRFCVAGDLMIVRNHVDSYDRMLPPPITWKKFDSVVDSES